MINRQHTLPLFLLTTMSRSKSEKFQGRACQSFYYCAWNRALHTSGCRCLLNNPTSPPNPRPSDKKIGGSEEKAPTIVKPQGNHTGWPVFPTPHLSSPPRIPRSLEPTGHHRSFHSNARSRPTRDPKSTSPPGGSFSQRILSHFEVLALKRLLAPGGGSSPGSRGD